MLRVGGRWLEGPGRDLVARRGILVGSGGQGRRRVAVSPFGARLRWAPAMREGVQFRFRGGEQFAWAAFGGRGVWAWGFGAVCGGRVWVSGRVGRAVGRGAPCGGCSVGCRAWGAVRGVRRGGLWRACVVHRVGGRGPCCRARGCACWWACVGPWVGSGEGEAGAGADSGGLGLGSCALCRCMCPLVAAHSCSPL